MTKIALHHVNYDGPCHYSMESDQIDEPAMFERYMTWKKEADIVQWMGPYESDATTLLEEMLEDSVFDKKFKKNSSQHVGVACSCNPFVGIVCDFVIAQNPKARASMPVEQWLPLY